MHVFANSGQRCCHNISNVYEGGIQDECMNTSEVRNGLVMPAEEVNRVKCTGELVIYQHVSEKTMELVNNVKCEGALYKPNHCVGTLVMEAGPENIVAEDCSEGAFDGDCNNTAVTVCCINWAPCVYENTRNSEEEISIDTTNKNLKVNFREIRPSAAAAANKDGVSPHNELEFVNFPIDKRYFSYSSVSCNAKMIGNTESGGTCDTGDRACKQQVHWLRLLHPIGKCNVYFVSVVCIMGKSSCSSILTNCYVC